MRDRIIRHRRGFTRWPASDAGDTISARRIAMPKIRRIAPCLWFDTEAEEAAKFYTSIFDDSKIVEITRYGKAGQDIHGKPPGSVLTVEFELGGQAFIALNGGPNFKFNEAVSFQILCDTQKELDSY